MTSPHASRPTPITVLGTGAWGTSLARLATANPGNVVRSWSRSSPETLEAVVADAEVLIIAIAMQGIVKLSKRLQTIGLKEQTIIVTATKGLDPETHLSPSRLWQAAFPRHAVAVLSGPNLSKEIDRGLPAATVVASTNEAAAQRVQTLISSDRFRVYTNTDPLGTELGGTLKNVMAIAVGACDGLNLGTNAKSALMTRALPEMVRVGVKLGADPETFLGLAGLGDMLATCSSRLSRNYRVGYGLAQGQPMAEILQALDGTAEGVNTTEVLLAIAKEHQISVPITKAVHALIHGRMDAKAAVEVLMDRELKPETLGLL
ncbi:MAG: NAD(P)H-dependent glycerol-3-phosphate dehydrogenase [Synechococcales cyanobacterium RU_4_20]|nr:NAD(P)H-dependent glycerol-3-phosphate dehydrogenase [Synechococcales cyanobacterium RU_4_20]NJR69569.1 NAD(P)H-dependent glycerol-3-phosphate dehydrogenase [Synechococcales cyanobacterium CRU_2_2]